MPDLSPSQSPTQQRLALLAERARGRCHACAHQRSHDLPHRTVFYCRAFATEMTGDERDAVRNCDRWTPFRATDTTTRRDRAASNPLLAHLVAAEDELFAALKRHLDQLGLDLKTILLLAQPVHPTDLAWVDGLDARFEESTDTPSLSVLIDELRALHYDALCEVLEGVHMKFHTETPHAG